jgi:hypothetical protein
MRKIAHAGYLKLVKCLRKFTADTKLEISMLGTVGAAAVASLTPTLLFK